MFSNRFKMAEAKQGKTEGRFALLSAHTPAGYGILLLRTSSTLDSLRRGSYKEEENHFYPATHQYLGNLGNWEDRTERSVSEDSGEKTNVNLA